MIYVRSMPPVPGAGWERAAQDARRAAADLPVRPASLARPPRACDAPSLWDGSTGRACFCGQYFVISGLFVLRQGDRDRHVLSYKRLAKEGAR